MGILDNVKDIADDLKQISDQGTQVVQQGQIQAGQTQNSSGDVTLWATAYVSTTRRLVWVITVFSMILFFVAIACDAFLHVNVSYVLTYDVGVWVPILLTYAAKSYLEKKNNVVNPEMIIKKEDGSNC